MNITNKKFTPYLDSLILLVAGCISVFAFAPFNKSVLIMVSLVALLWVIDNQANDLSKRKILIYGFIYGLAYFNVQIYWIFYSLNSVIGAGFWVSLTAQVGFTIFLASYIVLAIFLYIRLKTGNKLLDYVLLFPVLWVLCEWLRGWFLGGFPWCEVGYSQVGNKLLNGFYPLLGSYSVSLITLTFSGIILLVMQANGVLNKQTTDSSLRKNVFRISIIYCSAVLALGSVLSSIEYTMPYGKPISVALIQGNVSETAKWSSDYALDVYAKAIKETKADIVMIPETAISEFAEELPEGYLAFIINAAKKNSANLIVGMPTIIDKYNNYQNRAILLTDPKQPYYAKYHLVPYGEYIPAKWLLGPIYKHILLPMVDFSPGKAYQAPLVVNNEKLAFNICYENGFATEISPAAANSTLMVNLSDMVWYGKTIAMNEHLQMSQVRALENQRTFIQSTNTSITAIIDPFGNVQAQLPIFKYGVLKNFVQGRVGHTPFENYGNYPIIMLCLLILGLIIAYRKKFLGQFYA